MAEPKFAPSILSADFARLADAVIAVERAGADWVHVDVMDGHFVPNLTFGPKMVADLRKATRLPLDVHLMIERPEEWVDRYADAGATYLTIHVEASRDRDLELAAEEAVRRTSQCDSAGVRYAIEPHLDSICADVDGTRAFLDAFEGVTLTLDYGHFITAGETSERVHSLLPFASHVHVRGGAIGRLQASVKENTIDFPGMLAGLQELEYGGFLALEYVWVDWKGCNRTDNVSETLLLRRALESAASKITTVRTNHV